MNLGVEYQLDCGHLGKVIWISTDEQSFAVQGKRRSCITYGCTRRPYTRFNDKHNLPQISLRA